MLTYYYWPVPAGGAENQCRRLAATLVSRSYTCRVITCRHKITDPQQQTEENGVQINRMPTFETLLHRLQSSVEKKGRMNQVEITQLDPVSIEHKKNRYNTVAKLKKIFARWAAYNVKYLNIIVFSLNVLFFLSRKRDTIDILHVHTAEWIAGLAAFAGKIFNIPVLCKGANMPVFTPLHAVPLSTCCDIWRRKSHFIALTQAMKDNLVRNGVSDNRITVIPNGVKLPDQTTTPSRNSHFLYIGNFSQSAAHKSFDSLIEAWAKVHRLRANTKLLMLGGGNADEWIALANSFGCDDSIEFLGYRKKLTPFFLQTCCLLLPSRKEGISNALLEAQSFGLPAIVSDIPGNREIVLHEINGLIVPVENSDALAAACINMIDNPLLREKYGYAARKRIEELYSMERIADLTVNLYKELLHGAKV